MNNIYKLATY